MSWYNEELRELMRKREINNNSPFAKNHIQNIESLVFIITDMLAQEDFAKIKEEFLKVDGVQEVKRHLTKKVEIVYDKKKVGLEHLTAALKNTGYKYVSSACRKCMKK